MSTQYIIGIVIAVVAVIAVIVLCRKAHKVSDSFDQIAPDAIDTGKPTTLEVSNLAEGNTIDVASPEVVVSIKEEIAAAVAENAAAEKPKKRTYVRKTPAKTTAAKQEIKAPKAPKSTKTKTVKPAAPKTKKSKVTEVAAPKTKKTTSRKTKK